MGGGAATSSWVLGIVETSFIARPVGMRSHHTSCSMPYSANLPEGELIGAVLVSK